jgi:DNA-binding CsgD family transcriptional regulator
LSEVLAGRRFVSPRIGWRLSASGEVELEDPLASLTPTEVRVLRLLAQFKTSREIASIMSVSPRTVQNHRANMCAKLGLKGAKALLQFALDHAGTATG